PVTPRSNLFATSPGEHRPPPPFPTRRSSDLAHTGPGQDTRFVVPALAQRLTVAKRVGAPVVKVGNLEPVREFLHVRDVVDAYARDRKSTRLNSSHVANSYAVVCLEKKDKHHH